MNEDSLNLVLNTVLREAPKEKPFSLPVLPAKDIPVILKLLTGSGFTALALGNVIWVSHFGGTLGVLKRGRGYGKRNRPQPRNSPHNP